MPVAGPYYLGVDSGRSSTGAVIGDDAGRILGRATSGPLIDLTSSEARAHFIQAADTLRRDALDAAQLAPETEFEWATFGISGSSTKKFRLLAERMRCRSTAMASDAEVALEGATAGGPGVVVIAGTGSMALARDADDQVARCGGWGYVFGDEGGAFDIVRRALRKALAAEEGWGRPTSLTDMFRSATGAASVNDAMHRFYDSDWTRDRVAGIAKRVDAVAREGDAAAQRILGEAGATLCGLADNAMNGLGGTDEPLSVYPSGGVFGSRIVRDSFETRARSAGLPVREPAHGPSTGALLSAYRSADVSVGIIESP